MENLINGTVPVSRRQILSPEGLSVRFVVCGLWSVVWGRRGSSASVVSPEGTPAPGQTVLTPSLALY